MALLEAADVLADACDAWAQYNQPEDDANLFRKLAAYKKAKKAKGV